MDTPMNPQPQKKGNHGHVVAIVLLIILIAGILFWPEQRPVVDIPAAADTEESGDLGSIEADLEATEVEGMSDSL